MTFNYKLCTSVAQYICITMSDQQEMECFLVLPKPLIRLCSCVGIVLFFLITSFGDCTRLETTEKCII